MIKITLHKTNGGTYVTTINIDGAKRSYCTDEEPELVFESSNVSKTLKELSMDRSLYDIVAESVDNKEGLKETKKQHNSCVVCGCPLTSKLSPNPEMCGACFLFS